MSASPRAKNIYQSARPAPKGGRVVRLSGNMGRAVRVLAGCDPAELSSFVCSVVSLGYVATFTGTSDGGAISVVVYDGDTRWKGYGRDEDQLLTSFRDLLAAIRGEE